MVVIVNHGQIVKKFYSGLAALEYFESVKAKRNEAWLVSHNVALQLGYI